MTITSQSLGAAVPGLTATALPASIFYRSIPPGILIAKTGLNPNDGSHAGITGGRYNSPGSDPITYFAGSATLAVLEVEQEQMAVGLNLFPAPPRLTYAIQVQGAQVLDLTNTAIRLQLGVSENDLLLPRP